MKNKKTFLLIRYSSLGDLILATPVLSCIKSNMPEAEISFLTKEKYKGVFFNNPHVGEVLNKAPFFKKFDYIVDLHNSLRSNMHKAFIYADTRLTYNKASYARRAFLLKGIKSDVLEKNVVRRYLDALQPEGFDTSYRSPELYLSGPELKDAAGMVKAKKYIAIAPGAKWETKKWTEDKYISAVIKIIRDLETDVVLIGDSGDEALCSRIHSGAGILNRHITNMAGKTSLRTLFALIKNSEVLLSTDSGPMHAARALKTKTVALFGPTVREFGFMPDEENIKIIEKPLKCRPCSLHGSSKCRYKDRACMKRIETHEVIDKIKELLYGSC